MNGRLSAFGPKRTSPVAPHLSAFGGKADRLSIFAQRDGLREPSRLRRR